MATPSLTELHGAVSYHKACLATAEQQLKTLYPGDLGRIYTVNEKDVVALANYKNPAFKKAWKKLVTERDLVENVERLLEGCREYLLEDGDMGPDFLTTAKMVMGQLGSKDWDDFTLEVIRVLLLKDAFGDETYLDNFEDTAGGCDEVTQDAAIAVIEASMAATA
jgi:hypothetical protein